MFLSVFNRKWDLIFCAIYTFICLSLSGLEKPDMLNVSYTPGRRNVTLTWAYPYDGHRPVMNYTAYYQEKDISMTNETIFVTDGERPQENDSKITYQVDGLLPFSSYIFKVTAANDQGYSTQSVSTVVETKPDGM